MKIKIRLMMAVLILTVAACSKEDSDRQAVSATPSDDASAASKQSTSSVQWVKGWRDGSALKGPRAGAATVVVNGYIYVIGGVNGFNFVRLTEYAKINDDGSLSPWKETSLLNEERGFIDAVAKDGYIYVVGGGNGPNGKNLLRTVERAKVNEDCSLSSWQTMQS